MKLILCILRMITEIKQGSETNEIIKTFFESLLQKYQSSLEERMIRSEFVFDSVDLLYYELHKISLIQVDHTQILQNGQKTKKQQKIQKTIMINAFNKYAVTVALNY